VTAAALKAVNQCHWEVGRPTADLIIPTLSEHTVGQLLQMLMLATVVEARLMGVNPYSQPGLEALNRSMVQNLRTPPETPTPGQGAGNRPS